MENFATREVLTSTKMNTLVLELNGKQAAISDLDTIRSGANAGATAYQKPSGGIPESDLAQAFVSRLDALEANKNVAAEDVSYNASTAYTSGNVGYAIKALQTAVAGVPTYSAGTGISISNNTISVNTSSLNYNNLSNIPLQKTAENGFKIVAHKSNSYNTASSENAFAEGSRTKASGRSSHAEGNGTKASGEYSHAEGNLTTASGERSHAEGNVCIAQGYSSHAEGYANIAYGRGSHAEGCHESPEPQITRAYTAGSDTIYTDTPIPIGYLITGDTDISYKPVQSCQYQENEGDYKVVFAGLNENLEIDDSIYADLCAYGEASHTEGWSTHAYGKGSHAEGVYTVTTNEAEHASGRYNKSTSNVTQFSVGIGADEENCTNAFEIDVNGNVYIKGIGTYDGTNIGANGVKSVQQIIADLTQQIAALTNNQ